MLSRLIPIYVVAFLHVCWLRAVLKKHGLRPTTGPWDSKRTVVLWFSEFAPHRPSGGSLGFFFGCSPHPKGSKFCRLFVEHC